MPAVDEHGWPIGLHISYMEEISSTPGALAHIQDVEDVANGSSGLGRSSRLKQAVMFQVLPRTTSVTVTHPDVAKRKVASFLRN